MSRFCCFLAVAVLFIAGSMQATCRAGDATTPGDRPIPAIERALIVSVDGLRPDMLLRCNTPAMHALYQGGSFTFWAKTTAVAVTLPSHTSMLTGATPNRHGITWNRDLPFSEPVYPLVPTLFEAAHKAGYTTAMVSGKSKFATLNKPNTIDWVFIPDSTAIEDPQVAEQAVRIIHAHKPQVLFVHFPSVDNAGHQYGWGTAQQTKAVEGADVALAQVLAALDEEKIRASTLVILTADHGGAGRMHGPDDPRSRHIPWIASGPGVRQNLDLTTYAKLEINTEDTFATVCWALNIPVDAKNLDGKPITEIADRSELLAPAKN